MRVGVLQFSCRLGQRASNINHVEVLLSENSADSLDLLVLPELAFSGYNHTLSSIVPLLEPTCAGPTTVWARQTAATYKCIVSVGYPERFTPPAPRVELGQGRKGDVLAYNSTVTVSPEGEILAHYRKTHLYYTDEGWAKEGPEGWLTKALPPLQYHNKEVKAAFGICMDLNPYRFTAPWDAYEFCTSAVNAQADALVLSMAWLSSLPAAELKARPQTPDLDTFTYWLNRLTPLIEADQEVLVVCANRTGEEPGRNPCGQVEEGVRYAGTSWVGRVGKGKVHVWGMMGRAEDAFLAVDTEAEPTASFLMSRKAKE
ncbi:MAG: hypothetical protein Q9163_005829 [Psora crenata]